MSVMYVTVAEVPPTGEGGGGGGGGGEVGNRGSLPRAPSVRGPPSSASVSHIPV